MPSDSEKPKRNCVSAKFLADHRANFTVAGFRMHCSKLDQYTNPKGGGLDKIPLNTIKSEKLFRAQFTAAMNPAIDDGAAYRSAPDTPKWRNIFLRSKTRYQLACHLLGIGQVAYWTGSKGRVTLLGLDIDDHESSDPDTVLRNCTEALKLFSELTEWTPQTCRSGRGLHGFLLLNKGWLTAQQTNEFWHGIVRLVQAEAKRQGFSAKLECKGKARIIDDSTSYGGVLLKDPFTGANPTDAEIDSFWTTLEEQSISDTQLKNTLSTLANLPCETEMPIVVPANEQVPDAPPLLMAPGNDSDSKGAWAKNCRQLAIHGLQEHDSMPDVVFQLSKWLYFIELWDLDEDDRFLKVVELLQKFCLVKHNGFITRLNNHHPHEVLSQVERIVEWMVNSVTQSARECFARIRTKRKQGKYKDQWFLEAELTSICISSPVKLTKCCSVSLKKKKERFDPAQWKYSPDLTPLPEALEAMINKALKKMGARQKTYPKIVGVINHLKSKNGEARLGIESLKKMGFSDHRARQHVALLQRLGLVLVKGYSPVVGLGKLFVLTAEARELLGMQVVDIEED